MKQIKDPKPFILKTPESWFMELLNQMEQKIKPEYPDSIYFHINDEVYMEYDKNSHILWYSYSKIYSILEDKFKLNGKQINELIKVMVNEHPNLRVDTTQLQVWI